MSATSNNTILADNEPSICIPRVFANIDRKRIHNVFQSLFGPNAISQIDMVKRTSDNGEEYNRVFLHFNKWPKTLDAQKVRQKLLSGEKVKVVYDEPWFWYMSASKVERPQPREHRSAPSPYIDLAEEDSSRTQIKGDKRDYRSQGPQQHRGGAGAGAGAGKYYQEERRHQPREQQRDYHHHREDHREQRDYHHREREQEDRRRYNTRDRDHQERYGSYERPRQDFYYEHYEQRRPQHHQQYRERDEGRRGDYAPKFQKEHRDGRGPRTPEIAEWMGKGKTVPGAPVKSVRPKLMLDEDETVPSTAARSLEFGAESEGVAAASTGEMTTASSEGESKD